MRKHAWWGIVWLFGTSVVLGQVRTPKGQMSFAPQTITLLQGQSIVKSAWERERKTASRPDCSHLVHDVYSLAGFPYPYTDSFDLYGGTREFVRVVKPQPGDLIVWRGHVGIVVNPREHSFYSSVSSGLRTEFYDAPEWRARGPVRFYRYAAATLGDDATEASARLPRLPNEPAQVVATPQVDDPGRGRSGITEPIRNSLTSTTIASSLRESSSNRPLWETPSSILVASLRERPAGTEIAQAISELNNGTGNILREGELARLNRKVIVYDTISVTRTTFNGDRGLAEARIQSPVTLLGERIEREQHDEHFRWELLRVSGGWEVLTPKDRAYVPRDVAVYMLAARLASLTRGSEDAGSDSTFRQQAQIIHTLNALFESR